MAASADREVLIRRGMTNGYQILSLLTPPAYAAFVLYRKGRSAFGLNRLLRATWVGGASGIAAGGLIEYVRSSSSPEEKLRTRRMQAAYSTSAIRADDHATIGAVLSAVLIPAIFWKRASVANLVLGGAGLGSAVGLVAHYARTLSGSPPPKVNVPTTPITPTPIA